MKNALILLLCLLWSYGSGAQEDWVLKKDKENIQIYVKKIEGYNMKAFRGETEIETTLSNLIALLLDIPGYANWAPNTKKVEVLEKKGEANLIYYMLTGAPWPVNDRDGIYTLQVQKDEKTGGILITTGCLKDYIPEKKSIVRIKHSKGYWKLIPLGDKKVKVIYQNHAEPGGNIPGWLSNSSVVDVPFAALKNIRELVNLSKYQNKHFEFLR